MGLGVEVKEKNPGIFTVSPVGEIDSETYGEFDKVISPIVDKADKVIMLDMQSVTYISSMGISVIFKTKKAMEIKGGTLLIINLQPQVKKVFEIIEAIPTLDIFANVEEADAYLIEMQRREIEKNKNNS